MFKETCNKSNKKTQQPSKNAGERPSAAAPRMAPAVDSRAELDALETFVRARQARLTRCVESDLGLQYQVLKVGERVGDKLVAQARKKMLLQDEGKTLEDASLLDAQDDAFLDDYDSKLTIHRSYDVASARIPGVVLDTGASFRWNIRRLERGWRGSPSCTAPRQLTYSTATNRIVRKNAPQLIPGLVGTGAGNG